MAIDLGDTITRSVNFTNAAGGAADVDTVCTYAVTAPDLTAGIAPAVQHGATGEYYVNFPTVMAGLYREQFTGTVAGTVITIRRSFTVEDLVPPFVDTDEAIDHLRASGLITTVRDLETLRGYCRVACAAVGRDLGRVIARRTVTETQDGGGPAIRLTASPVISVASVTESGTLLAATDYVANPETNLLYRGATTTTGQVWSPGRLNISIVLDAGYTVPPVELRKVALNGVQRMWANSQQMPHPSMDDFGADVQVQAGVLTPLEFAAYESYRVPVIA